MTKLQKYNFQLIHKLRSSQKKVDILSHRPDHTQGKDNNEDQTLLKEEWFKNIVTQEDKFWKKVEEAKKSIEEVRGVVEHEEEGWRQKGKVLFWKERIYVPNSATFQEEIITKHHNFKLAGHPKYTKTYKLITKNYWWPRMLKDIKQCITMKEAKETISLAQAKDAHAKEFMEINQE